MRKIATVVAAAALAVLAPAGIASAADFGGGGEFNANGVNIRTCPSTSCTSVGLGYKSHDISVDCVASLNNGSWVYLQDHTNGKTGWSSRQYVYFYCS